MFDPVRICEILNDEGVDYVVMGGFAAVVHGSPLPTRDIDIVPTPAFRLGRAESPRPDRSVRSFVKSLEVGRWATDLTRPAVAASLIRARIVSNGDLGAHSPIFETVRAQKAE